MRLLTFILLISCSLFAGYVGGTIAQQPFLFEDTLSRPFIIEQPVSKKSEGTLESLHKRTQSLIVTIAVGDEKQRLTNSMIRAYGAMLTSDGWVVVPSLEHIPMDTLFGVRADGSSSRILRRVADPSLGVEYFKMEGSGMGSVDFLPKEQSFEARYAYVVMPRKTISRILTIRRSYPQSKKESYVRNSDILEKGYFTPASAYLNGSPVFTEDSQFFGIISDSIVIPSFYIQDGLKRLLRTDSVKRASLNLSYIDLAANPSLLEKPQMGAMIVADKNGIVVKGKSGKVILMNGDIITKINAEEINENQSLSELLSQYSASDEILLTYTTTNGKEHMFEAVSQ